MEEKNIKIKELLNSQMADDDEKGNLVFEEIKKSTQFNNTQIVLDFGELELVNTAFLNNAIGRLFNKAEFDLSKNNVKVVNIRKTVVDLLRETISVAKERYKEV